MKKLIFSLVAALCCSASMYADDDPETLVATLNHKGTLSAYYGLTAFAEAMENAENGDEITLSGGTFYASMNGHGNFTYSKAVTIRGAGIYNQPDKKTKATKIVFNSNDTNKDLIFNLPSKTETDARLYIEGVSFGLNESGDYTFGSLIIKSLDYSEATITKCYANTIKCDGSLMHLNRSKIYDVIVLEGYGDIQNCIIFGLSSDGGVITSQHCAIMVLIPSLSKSTLHDSVIIGLGSSGGFPYGTTLYNCLFCCGVNWGLANHQSCHADLDRYKVINWVRYSYGDDGTWDTYWHSDFRLKEEAKSLYPSSDGTEIGIYGGNYPYSVEVNLPYVTNIVPGNRTTDGKLPVTIEVK